MFGKVIQYEHHGTVVAVKEKLKGTHRKHCLCFECDLFKPRQANSCAIAERLYALCREFGLATPVFECSQYVEGTPDLSAMAD